MEKGDYVVAKQDKQTFAVLVSSVTKDTIHGFLAKDYHISHRRSAIELVPSSVVVNLGKTPRSGSVYGAEILPALTMKRSDYGDVHFFYKIKKEAGAALMAAFDKSLKILKKHRLDFLPDRWSDLAVWEVLSAELGGKYAGRYKHSRSPEKNPHRFQIRPEKLPVTEFEYCILHETAHYLDAELLESPKLKAAWIRLFNTSIALKTISKEQSIKLMESLFSGQTPPSAFASELEEDDTLAYRHIIRTIKAEHAVGVKELDTLFETDNADEIRELWPRRTIHQKELAPIVSEYATTNVTELLAESVAFHLLGRKLPKKITELVEATFSYARMKHNKR